jgi:hypothetical protein
VERGTPGPSPPFGGRLTARHAVEGLDRDARRSEGPAVMVEIPSGIFSAP